MFLNLKYLSLFIAIYFHEEIFVFLLFLLQKRRKIFLKVSSFYLIPKYSPVEFYGIWAAECL